MPMPGYSGNRPMTATTLRIVRFAMLAGLLLFVGATLFVHSQAPGDVPPNPGLPTIRLVGYGMCVAALGGIAMLRGVRERAPVEARGTISLIGSALGEAAALLGGVYFFLGGEPWVFLLGLLVFLLTWGLLPADPEAV